MEIINFSCHLLEDFFNKRNRVESTMNINFTLSYQNSMLVKNVRINEKSDFISGNIIKLEKGDLNLKNVDIESNIVENNESVMSIGIFTDYFTNLKIDECNFSIESNE